MAIKKNLNATLGLSQPEPLASAAGLQSGFTDSQAKRRVGIGSDLDENAAAKAAASAVLVG
ncbi:hypothetical protein [Stutzerimonas stutzeri]|uniref:hypothetical protein n=1 Tax=Stutzerimonas stutzeri TaxID=316 RepID=UPI0011E89E91|nr:hypothetical protein [Stutzerimonas stutzeri]